MSLADLVIASTRHGTRVDLRVVPRASRTAIDGVRAGRLVVRVTAPPVDDAANDAVVKTLAAALDLPRSAVRIVAGADSRNKSVEVVGMNAEETRRRLAGRT
jgi:uncharacterized protein (TIGR00251 family)